MSGAMKVSANCAKFIAGFEGGQSSDGRFHAYYDRMGRRWTIGYGHTEGVTSRTHSLTKGQAEALLTHDLNHAYAPAVDAQCHAYRVRTLLSQNAFDALVSLAYNCGVGILSPIHTIGQALKVHDLKAAARAFVLYDHDANGVVEPGLRRRREAEAKLFEKPVKK